MPSWPLTLPQDALLDGYDEQFADDTIRTPTDAGAAKKRPRSDAAPDFFVLPIDLTRTQVGILEDFYKNTLAQGSLAFDWLHPRKQTPASFRFLRAPKPRPESQTSWIATLELELLV